ncbi:MAG: hypothetical protein HGB10_07305 [Coriobacteriia bacterium]|nr:hypothetical protein [Coriobacteriia bacterium]
MTISKATYDRWVRESEGIIVARTAEEKAAARDKAAKLRRELSAQADRVMSEAAER